MWIPIIPISDFSVTGIPPLPLAPSPEGEGEKGDGGLRG